LAEWPFDHVGGALPALATVGRPEVPTDPGRAVE